MRIAYVCADPGVPVFGSKGCSVHAQEVLRTLHTRGFSIDLFASRLGGELPVALRGIRVHRLPAIASGEPGTRESALEQANKQLPAILAEQGTFDLLYERYALWSWRGLEYARAVGVPSVLEVNAPLIEEQVQHRTLIDRDGAEQASRRAMMAASVVACVSAPVADYARRFGAGVRACVIPNGVDPKRFMPRPKSTEKDSEITIGFVGSLRPWHAIGDLVRAFDSLHQVLPFTRLLIVGDGPRQASLQRQLQSLTPSTRQAVTSTGVVPVSQVPELLHSMDIAVAPYANSKNLYFSPLKLFEYMAVGLPVVASASRPIADVISDEHNGLLYPPGDVIALADCLTRLADDPELRWQLGHSARHSILTHHTWDAVVDRLLSLTRTTRTQSLYAFSALT